MTALINIQRREDRAIKGEEIASIIDRNPGTIRNQMQSLKALKLVEGVPGPKGGYRATAEAFEMLNLSQTDSGVAVPVTRNGSLVEGLSASKISLVTVMNPDTCNGVVNILGNVRIFDIGDEIEIGPTPVNKLYMRGYIVGRDDIANRLIFDISEMIALPKVPVKKLAHDIVSVGPGASLKEASRKMVDAGVDAALVEENGNICGLITVAEIAGAVAERMDGQKKVEDVMLRENLTVDVDDGVYEALKKIKSSNSDKVLVTEAGHPRGIFSAKDLVCSMTRF